MSRSLPMPRLCDPHTQVNGSLHIKVVPVFTPKARKSGINSRVLRHSFTSQQASKQASKQTRLKQFPSMTTAVPEANSLTMELRIPFVAKLGLCCVTSVHLVIGAWISENPTFVWLLTPTISGL